MSSSFYHKKCLRISAEYLLRVYTFFTSTQSTKPRIKYKNSQITYNKRSNRPNYTTTRNLSDQSINKVGRYTIFMRPSMSSNNFGRQISNINPSIQRRNTFG